DGFRRRRGLPALSIRAGPKVAHRLWAAETTCGRLVRSRRTASFGRSGRGSGPAGPAADGRGQMSVKARRHWRASVPSPSAGHRLGLHAIRPGDRRPSGPETAISDVHASLAAALARSIDGRTRRESTPGGPTQGGRARPAPRRAALWPAHVSDLIALTL